jgi:hypothetical protein
LLEAEEGINGKAFGIPSSRAGLGWGIWDQESLQVIATPFFTFLTRIERNGKARNKTRGSCAEIACFGAGRRKFGAKGMGVEKIVNLAASR